MLWKWNYETHEYDPFPINPEWYCATNGADDELVNCPHCGWLLPIAKCYTSCEIHEQTYGFGYMVCEECSNEEWERRRKYKNE